ncbi:hypothetical protein Pcinc_041331, partial [Petrolisthes cinctipes]
MTDDSSSTNQNTALRDKFVSVVGPVFAGGDEGNILTLLTSLANVCRHDEGLLVTPTDVENNESNATGNKATEFTCWLLAELITVNGSKMVCEANINLQVTIMRLLATRSPQLFVNLMRDYVTIGLEGTEVLFGEPVVSCQCFSSVIDKESAHPRPRIIEFTDNPQLDHALTNIIMVIGDLKDDLFHLRVLHDKMWLLSISCLEAGDDVLKAASLSAISSLLDACGLPVSVERVDYLIQCVAAAVLLVLETTDPHNTGADCDRGHRTNGIDSDRDRVGDGAGSSSQNTRAHRKKEEGGGSATALNHLEVNLCSVLSGLQQHLPQLPQCIREDLLAMLSKALSPPSQLEKIPDVLRKPVLQCFSLLHDSLASSPHKTDDAPILQKFVKHNLLTPEVVSVLLAPLVQKEVMGALSATPDSHQQTTSRSHSRKRRFSETEPSALKVVNLSRWWKDALEMLSEAFCKWCDSGGGGGGVGMEVEVRAATEVVAIVRSVATAAAASSVSRAQTSLQFFPDAWLTTATDSLLTVITMSKDISLVLHLLDLFWGLIWTCSMIEPASSASHLAHTWLALATLPWMATEVNLMDLKLVNARQFTHWSAKLKWNEDVRVKSKSIRVIAVLPGNVAPRWRCQVVRAALSEQDAQVMPQIATCFPLMVQQLGSAGGQQLVGEVVGAVINSPDTATVRAAAHSFRQLLCALLHLTSLRIDKCKENEKTPISLHCTVCNDPLTSSKTADLQRVDPTLVSRFLELLRLSNDAGVVVAVVESLPAVVNHSTTNTHVINQYLFLLSHPEKSVVSALARNIGILVCPPGQPPPSQDSKNLIVSKEGEAILLHLNDIVKAYNPTDSTTTKTVLAVLEVLHHLVKRPLYGLTGGVLVLLVRCLVVQDRTALAQAHLTIHALASTLHITLRDLYTRHRHSLAQVLCEIMNPGEVAALLNHVAEVFQWPNSTNNNNRNGVNNKLRLFARSQLQHLLPVLANRASIEAKPVLLQELAASCGHGLRDILIDHFQHILAHLVFHHTKKEQEAVLKFIAATTDIHIQYIRRCSVQNQVNELVLGLHEHRGGVLQEFSHMKTIDPSVEQQSGVSSRCREVNQVEEGAQGREEGLQEIADYLSPRLLGILGFLDSKLVSSSTMYKEKRSALWSLSDLLVLMGKRYISPVSRKILASLKTALKLKDEEFYDIGCHAWTNFLYNLDESTLVGLIEEVVAVMKPLVKKRPEQMAPVLTSVLVETPSVKEFLANMPLLPEDDSLSMINQAILEHQLKVVGGSTEEVLKVLCSIMKGLTHESVEVRVNALHRLHYTLRHNQPAIHLLTTQSDNVHPTISELFSFILSQCREVEEEVQLTVAECLGLLGAIDPSRLYTYDSNKEALNEIHLNIENELFIVQLVTELGRAFLAATDANTQTCASYAMQEVTRLYGIRESGSGEATPIGSQAWEKLPYHLQEIICPLLTSKYTLSTGNNRSSVTLPSPIFGSGKAKTFQQWLTSWECSLVDLLQGERASQVFSACKPILRRDTTTAIYLLPSILICVLCETSDHQQQITTEVLSVMNQLQEKDKDEAAPSILSIEIKQLAVQTVFSALDYLSKWAQKKRQAETQGKKGRGAFVPSTQLKQVMSFLEKIPADILAHTSYKSHAYSRALMHIEAYIKDNPQQVKEHLRFLQCIYVSLDEPDGVAGVAVVRQDEPTLDQQVIQYEATGRLQDALGCYERLCVSQGSEEVYKGLLECYLNLDQPHSVMNITQGLLGTRPELESSLNKYRVEAAWKLGQWEQLEGFLKKGPEEPSWGQGVGQILLSVRARDLSAYHTSLSNLRTQQISSLSAASMEKWAYQRAYPCIIRLHMLTELEEMVSGVLWPNQTSEIRKKLYSASELKTALDCEQQPLTLDKLVERWDQRLRVVQTSHRYLEPILSFRRTLLVLGKGWLQESNPSQSSAMDSQLERTWLHSARVARKAGHTQQGEWALLGAGISREVFVERAKWHWVKGEQHLAVTTLNHGIDKFFPDWDTYKSNSSESSKEERLACGRAKLLLARYSEESATQEVGTIKQYYRDACEMNRQWEDGHFHLAMYYDRILTSLDVKEKPVEWIHHIVLSFGKSLQYGCKHIYQSMPRMFGLWLEFGTKVSEQEARDGKTKSSRKNSTLETNREKLANLNGSVGAMMDRLPHYMVLTALPQLISRICHSHNDVFIQLCKIIATMLSSFPQQTMWHMIAVSKSSYHMRVVRCIEIFEAAKRMNPGLSKFIADATKLADKFLELSNKPVEKGVPQVSLNNLLRALPRLLADPSFSNIMLPLQHQMSATLPIGTSFEDLHTHNPFPRAPVYLSGIQDQVEIMQSLQLPKKITLKGSDGKCYIMMCKPKDDLRKDCRLMEFNNFVNFCLLRDPESRKRDLHIRTYTVVPLNEECGLIEWIENLSGLRQILHRLYRDSGVYMGAAELKQNMCKRDSSLGVKREIFMQKLLPRHPPVFSTWFLRTFPDPQAWVRARLAYCRTTAVMSMVGYILGLGDRHGENILFDASSGDTVHVDFNCLFNKGETFDWPEKVPFRLTHNMVAAMGPTGYEGIYRKACEVTMRVMREEREALMSVLRPFIHDPLVEWSRGDKSAKNTGEINNEKAQMHVNNIEQRLSGQIRTKTRAPSLPLSVEGQVNALIEDSTSIDNLCEMYIGTSSPSSHVASMSLPLQDDNQSQPASSSKSPILTRCHHACISVLKTSLWVRVLRRGPRQPEEREGDEDVEEAKTVKSMRRTDEQKGDEEDLNVESIRAVSLGTVERKGEEEVEQTKTVKSLSLIEEREGQKEKMKQQENGEREGEKEVELQVVRTESTQRMKHSQDTISLASSFSSSHSITTDTASINNTSITENSEVWIMKEAEEELRKVKEMEAPMTHRRWKMVNLRHQREEANNTNKSRWYSPTLAYCFIQKGKLAWKNFRESVQISKRPINKINGRFGSSGVAVFRLAKDLLLLNLFLCLVLQSCLYIPILLFSHQSHHWKMKDW